MDKKESKMLVTGVFLNGTLEVSSDEVEDNEKVQKLFQEYQPAYRILAAINNEMGYGNP